LFEIQIHVWLCFQNVSNMAKYDKTIDLTLEYIDNPGAS
jgi:hypothetical protein